VTSTAAAHGSPRRNRLRQPIEYDDDRRSLGGGTHRAENPVGGRQTRENPKRREHSKRANTEHVRARNSTRADGRDANE